MDEREPLLQDIRDEQDLERRLSRASVNQKLIIDFDPNGDAENPIDWPKSFKWSIVALLAFMAFVVTFTCISVVPVASRIVRDLDPAGRNDKTASVLTVTIWELGEAAGPLFIGPLSEMFGRHRVLNVANFLFIGFTAFAACCSSKKWFIAARCLTGVAVASNVLNPAIIGDMYISEERGSAMSLIVLAPMVGGAIGPALAGVIADNLGWRTVLWVAVCLASACEIFFLCCFRETYKVTILSRRASKVRKETGNVGYQTVYEFTDGKHSAAKVFWISIARPFGVLFSSPVLQALALFGGMTFTWFYIMSTTLPDILEGVYNLSPAVTGYCFISFSLGSVLSVAISNLFLDRVYMKLKAANELVGHPEHRLPLAIIGALTLPVVVAFYGWFAHWILPLPVMLLMVALVGSTLTLGYVPLMAYTVDALGRYSASGTTAMIVTRCLMGTFFPLTADPLVKKFGYGWAFTVLGGISIALAPIPILIFRHGAKWRQSSFYTKGG